MFDPGSIAGPLGGIIALAWGAGAVSGYLFCFRTLYKVAKAQADKDEKECTERIEAARLEISRLINRCDEKQRSIDTLQERLLNGMQRQQMQISESGLFLIEQGKIRRTMENDDEQEDGRD